MINVTDYIKGTYEFKIPWDGYLLKYQIKKRAIYKDPEKCVSGIDQKISDAIECSLVDADDAGTFTYCLRNCARICESATHLSPKKLMSDILKILNDSEPEIIASSLCDIIGYGHLYFISKLIDFRLNLTRQWQIMLNKLTTKVNSNKLDNDNYEILNKIVLRRTGKELSRHRSNLESVLNRIPPEDLFCFVGLELKNDRKLVPINIQPRVVLNMVKEDHELYEKITVPVSEDKIVVDPDDLIAVSSLPIWAQKAFEGIDTLKNIQSKVFHSALNTYQNILISAPTGCGKTNIALLCILKNFKPFIEDGIKCGKVIYVAPMKALASEVSEKYIKALSQYGLTVKEVTGDFHYAKYELEDIDIMVTTPEKCDVVTRNSFTTGTQSDDSYMSKISCLIIDEIHLLNDERGPVIETVVARLFRLIESTQVNRRVVGISATLPNWNDVAQFLRVSPEHAYYFGREYRHVPLEQVFYGVKQQNDIKTVMLEICYENIIETVMNGKQCMVFVHSRNETLAIATKLIELIQMDNKANLFVPDTTLYKKFHQQLSKNKFVNLKQLVDYCFCIHHAGLSKHDRTMASDMFRLGLIKVLVSTSTLAWGVNLPAHCVIIHGTFIGGVGVDRNINNLELTQIMGRAGRPQYDTIGRGVLITEHKNLHNYLRMQTERVPIESQLHRHLENSLNAEIALGTINNESEAYLWLQYTYLYVRMIKSPLFYGITSDDDSALLKYRQNLIKETAKNLDKSKLIRYSKVTGEFFATDLGRIAAKYYVDYETIHNFAASINPLLYSQDVIADRVNTTCGNYITEEYILDKLCECKEFEGLLYRNEECEELTKLINECYYRPTSGINHVKSKVSILIQMHISRVFINTPSLVSDLNFIAQNTGRLLRSYYEVSICETVSGPPIGDIIYNWVLMFERQIWNVKLNCINVLKHFCYPYHAIQSSQANNAKLLSERTVSRLDNMFKIESLMDLTVDEIANVVRSKSEALKIYKYLRYIPYPKFSVHFQPITNKIGRIYVRVELSNEWSKRWNGMSESFYLWVCSRTRLISNSIITFSKACIEVSEFYIPLFGVDEILTLRLFSSSWIGLIFEEQLKVIGTNLGFDGYTDLKNLIPLSTSVLGKYESVYKFKYFNPLQTQLFPYCFLSDDNILVGAPTGSGKTLIAELALYRLFHTGNSKAVYIAPLKALAYERLNDWSKKFKSFKKIIEISGDSHTNYNDLINSDIIITTPEKWDGISRYWKRRTFVRDVGLIIIDEVHLLGEPRGAVLESIVTRLRFMEEYTKKQIRIVCMSTALANPQQISEWLSVNPCKTFNFSPAIRPVKCNLFIDGFPIKPYCPRMNSMNKPCFDTILRHDPSASILIFVSSRRQTRMTAHDFVGLLQLNSINWSSDYKYPNFKDEYLNKFVEYGIAIHHAGLDESDRRCVEDLFMKGHIKILIATSTLAWGVNLPAKIVIVKGTEYYDGRFKKYVDYSICDIMQMIGRAGRSIEEGDAFAYIYTELRKVGFYKEFMFSPFPTESCFHERILDFLNSEIATGSVSSKKRAILYLSSTFFYKRLQTNPQYYLNAPSISKVVSEGDINEISNAIITDTISKLIKLSCVSVKYDVIEQLDYGILIPTLSGLVASQYYISCDTVHKFSKIASEIERVDNLSFFKIINALSNATEFNQVPIRHNEDIYNIQLSDRSPFPIDDGSDPHAKTFLLIQARLFDIKMPVFDYYNDTKSILDQVPRIIQAFVDIFAICRNFKNVQYLLLLYKCLSCGLNPLNLNLTFDTSIGIVINVYNPLKKHFMKSKFISLFNSWTEFIVNLDDSVIFNKRDEVDLDIHVSINGILEDISNIHYILLVNERTNVIYGFKKITRSGNYKFRLKLSHNIRGNIVIKVILSSPTLLIHDREVMIVIKQVT